MTGHLIAIVGTSSVGKTSASARLQELLSEPYLVVGIDNFLNMFPHHWAGHPRGPGPGMWYEDSVDPDGSARARIRYGEAGERLLVGMRAAVVSMLDCGNNVILDEMPLDTTIVPAWRRAVGTRASVWVQLTADLDVIEAREAQRTKGRHVGNARGHHGITAAETFDLSVDTSHLTPFEVAAQIKAAIEVPSSGRRGSR